MKKLKVVKLNPILKFRLGLWDRYKGKDIQGYQNICDFVSIYGVRAHFQEKDQEDMAIFGCFSHMSAMQEKHRYVLKQGIKPMAFIDFRLDDAKTDSPRMYIQAIATHPLHQREGYGSRFVDIILKNPEKYMSAKPLKLYALVDSYNLNCKNFLQKYGSMKTRDIGMDFDRVDIDIDYEKLERKELEKGK